MTSDAHTHPGTSADRRREAVLDFREFCSKKTGESMNKKSFELDPVGVLILDIIK